MLSQEQREALEWVTKRLAGRALHEQSERDRLRWAILRGLLENDGCDSNPQDTLDLLTRLRSHTNQDTLKGVTHALCYWCIEVIERLQGSAPKPEAKGDGK